MAETAQATTSPVRIEREGDIAVIVIDNPPVNAGSAEVRRGLLDAVKTVGADPTIRAAVLIGAGRTFISGSDIREFDGPIVDPQAPAVIAAIDASPKPFVAAIHGGAFGGGLEYTLACDARIAASGTLVGLPEVTLGLIPGAGGSQRLPRIVGIAKAIDLIAHARRIGAEEAKTLGIIDEIVTGDLRAAAVARANAMTGKRRIGALPVPMESAEAIATAEKAALARAKGGQAIPEAVAMVKRSAELPIAEGLAMERAIFTRLREGEESAALRHLFFAERQAARVPEIEKVEPRPVKTIAVIGGGTMGAAISVAVIDNGLAVILVERDQAALDGGLKRIDGMLDRSVGSGRIDRAEAERRRARVAPSTELSAIARADFVIEAVFEDMGVKQELFRAMAGVAREDAVLASNTSYLDLDAIAAASGRPQDVVGLHFFSPANVMRLIEVVRGDKTRPDVLATALRVARTLGKLPVVARVGEGFIGNRILTAYRRQCDFMMEDGALPEEIDKALTDFGFALGPYATGDLAGLDIGWAMRKRLAPSRDPRERYVAIADRLCEAGRLGQKTGKGWYRYADGARRGEPDPEVVAIIEAASREKRIVRRRFSAEEIEARALAGMLNEAALILADGIAQRASDIDLVLVNGYGFPATKGGPIFWASRRDRASIQAGIDAIEAATGFGFRRGDVDAMLDGTKG